MVLLADADAPCTARALLLVDKEARRVLVDEQAAVEAEEVGIRAEEPGDVRLAREHVEALVLERAQVLAADHGRTLDIGDLEPAAETCFS